MADKPPSIEPRRISAERMTPLPQGPRRATGEHLALVTKDTALNVAGILRDVIDDFKSSDRYFKYKAAVLVCWLGLSVTSIGVACPSSGTGNSIGARLVIAGEAAAPIYMVKNDSTAPWQDVEVLVNGTYRSTAAQVDANGGEITLSPVVLYDAAGTRAPANLKITEISVQVGPDDKVALLKGGAPR